MQQLYIGYMCHGKHLFPTELDIVVIILPYFGAWSSPGPGSLYDCQVRQKKSGVLAQIFATSFCGR